MTPRRLMLIGALSIVYALCYSAIKSGLPYAPPLRFAGLRAGVGGVSLLATVFFLGQPVLPPRRLWRGTVALAFLGTFLGYGAMFLSPGRTGAGLSSVVGNTGPILTVLLAAIVLGEPLTRNRVMALAFGTAGVAAIAWPDLLESTGRISTGAAFPLAAAASAASASVLLKKLDVGTDLLRVAVWQLLLGAVLLLALSSILESGRVLWTPAFNGILAFLGLVGTALALSVWYWLIQREQVGQLSLLLFLVPILGLGLAYVAFDEPFGSRDTVGVALALGGIALASRPAQHDPGLEGADVGPQAPAPGEEP